MSTRLKKRKRPSCPVATPAPEFQPGFAWLFETYTAAMVKVFVYARDNSRPGYYHVFVISQELTVTTHFSTLLADTPLNRLQIGGVTRLLEKDDKSVAFEMLRRIERFQQ